MSNPNAAPLPLSNRSRAARVSDRSSRDHDAGESLTSLGIAKGLLGWRYAYRDRAPTRSPPWVSSGLELSVQLRGRWGHRGRWGGTGVVAPGECLFLSPGEPYSYVRSLDPGGSHLQVGFLFLAHEHRALKDTAGELRWASGQASEPRLLEVARYLADAIERGRPPSTEQIEDALMEVVARRCELHPLDGMARAKQEIERCFASPLYVRHFADLAGVREATFSRQFVARFAQTPVRYRLHLRINAAARQLALHTGDSVRDIAWRVGFEDESFFFRTFRALVGATPQRYAARARRHGSAADS